MASIRLGERIVGDDEPPFVILEAGINHNGELGRAFEMISLARKLGADAIKFQTFRAEEFVGDPGLMFTYRSQDREVTEPMLDMFRRHEFSESEWSSIKKKCDEEGILFLSTPQNRSDLDLLLEIGIPAIKVGSDDFTNLPLLKDYTSTGLPMLVSCGMADLAEVYQALDAIGTMDGYPTVLLLCTSQYPTPPEDVNLRKLSILARTFSMAVMGFSDHTQGPLASSLALALGAKVFEKHFTLDHNLPGPDHWFSEDPSGAKEWIDSLRMASKMMGNPFIRPTRKEREMRALARRSIVALRDISEDEKLDANNIGLRRPGNGLPPQFLGQVEGRKAAREIKKGKLIEPGDFR